MKKMEIHVFAWRRFEVLTYAATLFLICTFSYTVHLYKSARVEEMIVKKDAGFSP